MGENTVDIGSRLKKVKDIKKNLTINLLVYGAPGVGKTSFIATAGSVFLIDLEKGTLSLSSASAKLGINTDNVDVFDDIEDLQDLKDAVGYALEQGYKTIAIDSLTKYADLIKDDILDAAGRESMQLQDWGEVADRIKRFVGYLAGRGVNIIFVALEKEVQEDGTVMKRPELPGKLPQAISGVVDIVAYMYADEKGERHLLTDSTKKIYAKDRSGLLEKVEVPDFLVLFEKAKSEKPQDKAAK